MRIALALFATAALAAAEPVYDLHEWGVFTMNPGNPFAQQDYKEEWASFPDFFSKQPPLVKVGKPGVVVRKPVIFIQAEDDFQLDLTVTLRGGKPLVWWPSAVATGESLHITAGVWNMQAPRNGGPVLNGPPVPVGHWIEHLRAVGADFLVPIPLDVRVPGVGNGGDSFFYYDGLLPSLATPIVVDAGADKHPSWTVTNTATYPMLDLRLVWCRNGEVLVSPWQDSLAPGATISVPLWPLATALSHDRSAGTLDAQLQGRLIAAGLTMVEADSLVQCWHGALFTQDGLTLIHRLPQATYESLLPLTAKPAPRQTVRVGLAVYQHVEPTVTADINALIDRLATIPEGERPPLMDRVKAYGGAAFPVLRARIAANDSESQLCRNLLAALDLAAP